MKIKNYLKAELASGDYNPNYLLAKELGISPGMLSHYTSGYTKQPPLELCKKIYAISGVIIYPYSLEAVREGEENE